MKIALCTTTINVPHVLKLYRACDPDVEIVIACDQKTPDFPPELMTAIAPTVYHTTSDQEQWSCGKLIPWDCIQRRNMAFLDALQRGADIVVSIDDDNMPLCSPYCATHEETLRQPHSGLMSDTMDGWFDVGALLRPAAKHRGFPHQFSPTFNVKHAVGAKVGVSAGICLGDPDVDAITRIANAPEVHQVSLLLSAGIVNNPHTWTVFNSQNTAVLRELIPAWGMIPFVGRMDDIYASLICQRVMRERNLHVRFGKPFVWQSRNAHNLVKDLRGEIDGYENVERLADLLDHVQLAGKNVIADCRRIWDTLNHCDFIPGRSVSAMSAYLDDCESVL